MTSLDSRQISARHIWVTLFFFIVILLAVPSKLRSSASQSVSEVATVSAASFARVVAPESIAAAFGSRLATRAEAAPSLPLPTSLAGTTVKVNGELARLFYVSPGQINYLIPPGTPSGAASVVINSGDGTVSTGSAQIAPVAPALFTASGDGQGALASQLLRVKADGQFIYEPLAQGIVTRPIDFGEESDQLFLILYLTGIRQAAPGGVRVSLGGVEYAPLFVGAQGSLAGLDQINLALPRNFGGRGRIAVLVKANGYGASNGAEFEIGSGTQSQGAMQISAPAHPVLAGEELEVGGAGFAANPRENNAQIVADDGITAKAEVLAVGATTIRIRVPFGAGTGKLKISRGQSEASAAVSVRTSVSGFIERAVSQDGQVTRVPIAGARVRIIDRPGSERLTDDDGSFVMPDMAPSLRTEFEILPPGNGTLNFPTKKFGLPVVANRDNQIKRGDEQTVIGGGPFPLLADSEAPNGNAAADSPDQNLTLTYLERGRTPANLPVGHFSTRIAMITPFGQTISPGAKLSFPNADAIPAGTTAKLFKLDQTNGSATLGQCIEIGSATVTADGQRVETAPNAIIEGNFYFASIARPTAAINGRVVESDGRPVPRAIVQARGQSTFTDGFGGFVLNNVPVMEAGGDRVRVEVSYQRPDGRVSRKDSGEVELTAGALVTVKPDIALDPETTNFPPVILAPSSLTLNAGETHDFDLVAHDPDSGQAPHVNVSGDATAFTTLSNQGSGIFRLRLAPGANADGNYTLTLTSTDNTTSVTQNIAVTVTQASNSAPTARGQAVTTPEDTPRAITLTGSDSSGRALSYAIVSGPARGSLSGEAPNLTYAPAQNFNGADSFAFKVSNGSAESQTATVYVAVSPVNDAPVLSAPGPQTVNAGETVNLILTATDVDGDQALQFTATGLPPGTTFVETGGTSRQLSWAPTFMQPGTYPISITVTDKGAPALSDTKIVTITANAKWAKTSGPVGGIIFCFVNVGNLLYAGTEGAGVYRSTDNGQSWTPVNNGLPGGGLYIHALLANGGNLYAGTYFGSGRVYRSTDNGQSWTPAKIGLPAERLDVNALLANSASLFAGTSAGVYRSTDSGQSWTPANNGLSGGGLNVHALLTNGTSLYAGTSGGIYRSTDNGQSWAPTNTGLVGAGLIVNALLANSTGLYAGTSAGVYRSTNNGQSWTSASNGLPSNGLDIRALLANGASLYAGTYIGGVYRSVDNGQNWASANNGLSGQGTIALALIANGASLYVGTYSGVYRSTNGQSWTPTSSGFKASSIHTQVSTGNSLFAGTISSGVYRSTNNGQSWTPTNTGLQENEPVYVLLANGASLYAGTNFGVYRSTDNGQTWKLSSNGLSSPVSALRADGASLYAGTFRGEVYRSTDNGQNWAPANNGLPGGELYVSDLLADGASLYAGTFGGGVYRSTDNGRSWTPANNGITGGGLNVFSLLANGDGIYAGTNAGVYRSTDNGQSWTSANNGLPGGGLDIYSLLASGASLYAGTNYGVYRSTDNGMQWASFGSALDSDAPQSLVFHGPDLFAGTGGNGVFILSNNTQSWIEINANLTPANRSTNTVEVSGANLLLGTLGSGVFRSSDEGQSWAPTSVGLPPNANIQSMATNNATVWAATFGNGVFRSANQGASWTAINAGLANLFVNRLFQSGATLYAGTDGGVFRSTNGGSSWTAINAGLTRLRAVSFTIANGMVYAGTDGGGVFRLNPDGASWTEVSRGLTSQSVTALGASGSVLYAGTTGGGICVSRDGGENWTAVNNALPTNLNVFAFAVSGRKVYVGSVYGVFVTEDEGQSWKQVNAGLLNTFVTGLAVSGDQLFASTASGGVYISRIP